MCFVCSKELSRRLNETVLLSTHSICFGWEIRKIFFSYALLTGAREQTVRMRRLIWIFAVHTCQLVPYAFFNFISVVFMVIGFIIMATQFDDYHSSLSPDWSMWLAIVGCILAFISGVMCVIDLNRWRWDIDSWCERGRACAKYILPSFL